MKHLFNISTVSPQLHVRTGVLLFFLLSFSFFLFVSSAQAATLGFSAPPIVGTSSPFVVEVWLDADVAINAITVDLIIPAGLKILDISDGNSIINMWVEQPSQSPSEGGDEVSKVSASGIIPGGYSGKKGLQLQATSLGSNSISIDSTTIAYKSSANADIEKVTSSPLRVSVEENITNPPLDLEDLESPESFTPVRAELPDENDTPVWFVVFIAQDKKSGIDSYEAAESSKNLSFEEAREPRALEWKVATSPHLLQDQSLGSYIYVKATDKKGNFRIEKISPDKGRWYEQPQGYILIVLVLLATYVILHKKTRRTRPA